MSAGDRDDLPGARRAFRLPRRGAQIDAQVDEELQFHLAGRVEELMAQGRTRDEAEAEVRQRFGDLSRWRREAVAIDRGQARGEGRADILDTIKRETRQAARSLLRAPGFSVIAILTLALGLGAATAIFAVLDAVVLHPLPYPTADRLVWIDHKVPGVGERDRWKLGMINYFDFHDNVPALASLGLYTESMLNAAVPGGDPVRVRGAIVSASIFPTLGARTAALGRLLTDADNAPGAEPVIVLGHDFWQRAYGGDASVVDRIVDLEGMRIRVVGVTAPGVALPQSAVDVWMALTMDPVQAAQVNQHTYSAIGRLADGATPEQLLGQLQARERRFTELYPRAYSESFMSSTGFAPAVESLHEHVVGAAVTRTLWIMFGAVGLVLLVACAHVANLFLVRMEARRRETALRAALGASRGKLAWRSLSESLILTLTAASGGVALAYAALRGLLALAPPSLPRLDAIHLGGQHVVFVVLLAVIIGVAFGLLPVLRGGMDLGALRDGSRGMTSSRQRNAVRGALVVGQVALSAILITAGGLMLRSAARLHAVQPGFEAERVLVMDVAMPNGTYQWGDYAKVASMHRTFQRELAQAPGVAGVGAVDDVPMGSADGWGCSGLGFEEANIDGGTCVPISSVSPGYFEAMRIPLVRGRAPTWDEVAGGSDGVVISQALADHFWPGQDPIGRGVMANTDRPPHFRVVGVAGDVRLDGLEKPPTEVVYFPMVPDSGLYMWGASRNVSVMVRTTTDDAAMPLAAARRIMRELDPTIVVDNARWMEEVVEASLSRTTLAMLLLSVAAGMALLLSAVGIYGVIAYLVGQRRVEIGIRLALGARAGRVGRDVVLGALRLAVVGVVIGLVGAMATMRVLRSLLYDVSPTDPLTLGGVAALLLMLAALASWIPARRASRVPPMEALREG
ncbi:MAG: ADOP family duplicated permease [Gemmatimonadaceae bacterium]